MVLPAAMGVFVSRLLRPFSTRSSLSLTPESLAARTFPDNAQIATIAAGCFWGVEHIFRKQFGNGKGLLDAKVGYCGGDTNSPSYRNICTGKTGRMCFHFPVLCARPLSQSLFSLSWE